MAIRAFQIESVRELVSASYAGLPDLVVLAGGNGTGKSTLLDQLFRRRTEFAEPGTRVLYLGPSRTQRRGAVSAGGLVAMQGDLLSGLSLETGPTFVNFVPQEFVYSSGQTRGLEGIDDSYSLMKYEIQRLENLRREALAQLHDRDGQIAAGVMPDFYAPLRQLTLYLLPHLQFARVDQTDQNNLRCYFARTDGGSRVEVELDDLSSGEKAIIALFMPFLAIQLRQALNKIGVVTGLETDVSSVTALIDEPEIHLHPALQGHLPHYLRELSSQTGAQFILATHSPTLVDAAGDDELFVLMPSEFVAGQNQFRRLISHADRLDTVRELVGSASLVTRARPIVFVEGEKTTSKIDSDAGLLSILVPESAGWVVVPARGRSQALSGARQLHEQLAPDMPALPVFALVDADSAPPDDERMIAWPVAMIENLLLDANALGALVNPLGLPATDPTPAGVRSLLIEIADELREDEIRIRVERAIPSAVLRPNYAGGSISTYQMDTDFDSYRESIESRQDRVVEEATVAVDNIVTAGDELQLFRGKQILDKFFERARLAGHFSKASLKIQLAREATNYPRLVGLTSKVVARIRFFTPIALLEKVIAVESTTAGRDQTVAAIEAGRAAMFGELESADIDTVRQLVRQLAETLRSIGKEDDSIELRELIPMLGLGR